MTKTVLPGGTLGVLGSGQLGRMFAIAARRMGYRVHVLSPDTDTPTGQVADVEVTAKYDDLEAVARFAESVDVVTFEFENVPLETVNVVNEKVPVRPAGRVLHTTQHRLREKTFLRDHGFPVPQFHAIRELADLDSAPDALLPGVLKTAAWGYDGKGQAKVADRASLHRAWTEELKQEAILEELVGFEKEFSVVAARGIDGNVRCYAPIENLHTNHILDVSISPGRLSAKASAEAIEIATAVLTELDVVGVLCVEFFLAPGDRLLINELAPRPHNSGHLTIDAHVTCQFEQQVRAICGLPLGSTEQLRPAAMINLLGDVWEPGTPNWAAACENPAVKLHLYGKHQPRIGRKMGHMTVTATSVDEAAEEATAAKARLLAR
ncbi:5-(carboxyamino)imidazole ribonucleotide synthase [Blastopirellula marina]|uniref:N5-carboxyaminoimidazole ribonucleotide synthase n=1 Tax=Blastopirellula marina TaxID=124 RepID=A0A2S8G0Y5_9BACT|nr:5-(carboxyamino)imidazole ribonucleotide synthase [Blastopirellula marina]PQO38108.1 5-(carboxyamino)imidazole ribonucleotide synthase [Blastopirellula marina]PTL44764.1 5-(carboxyamino)imidazole ribonucleotide synthase [Blastopirellula marina]